MNAPNDAICTSNIDPAGQFANGTPNITAFFGAIKEFNEVKR